MISLRFSAIVAAVLVLVTGSAVAGPYSELIVFGDSLSDVGNIKQASFGLYPVSAYFDGRFSNGPVYSELLASALGLGTLTHSRSGGDNFAHGAAKTSGTGGFAGVFIQDIDEQVDVFLDSRTADPDALTVVFSGANDLLESANVSGPVGNLVTDITRLIAAGVENLLVPNLPLLGLTPRFNSDPNDITTMNQRTLDFNAQLAAALDAIELAQPQVEIFRLDIATLFSELAADPGAFGFANATDSAAPGLEYDTSNYNTNLIVSEPNSYVFWDDLHPTTAVHSILAQFALDAVTYSADFNFDGQVDARDLAEWEGAYQLNADADADGDGDSDGEDFLAWQRQYTGGNPQVAAVPEPATILLAVLTVGVSIRRRRRPPLH